MPQISIITPVWNGLPYLQACIESVRSQAFEDWELLISDNDSDDGTRDYLATLSDPRIRVFLQEHNLGINGNLNFLIQQARAPISQFLCADDYFMDADSISRILKLWSGLPDIGVIRANWNQGKARNAIEHYAVHVVPKIIEPHESDLLFFLFGCYAGNISNISLRTSVFIKMGGLNEKEGVVGDFDFWTRTSRHTRFMMEAANLIYVRAHAGQASNYLNRHGEAISQQYAIVEDLYSRLQKDFPVALLRIHATVFYDAMQRWVAVSQLLFNRRRVYFDVLAQQTVNRPMFLRPLMRWAIFLLSGGGRWGQTLVARRLLARQRLSTRALRATP